MMKRPIGRYVVYTLFLGYVLLMLWLLFGQRFDTSLTDGSYLQQLKANPLPFETIVMFAEILITGEPAYLIPHAFENLVGNVVMFVPLGWFLPAIYPRLRTAKSTFFASFATIASVECIQFFTLLGSLDFDDFLLNLIGAMIGFAVFRAMSRKFCAVVNDR